MGRKRKDASLAAPLAGRKRRRPEQSSGPWASLPSDIVQLVTDRILDGGDIADYVSFRAVCSHWRACTEPMDLRADSWIALCDGDAVWPEDAREIAMFHTRTARRLRVRLPKLRGYRVVGFSAGLLVLLHKSSAAVRVLQPFTGVAVDFPSLEPMYREAINHRSSFRAMRAAVCSSGARAASIAVVIWFSYTPEVVAAEAGSDHWYILHRRLRISNTLVFQGRLYATMPGSFEVVQLYPPPLGAHTYRAVAHVPNLYDDPLSYNILLVESDGTVLLVVRHHVAAGANLTMKWWEQLGFTIYAATMTNNGGRWKFTPVSSLGDRALFLGNDGCLSVSTRSLPSLSGNSIYFSVDFHPALMHSLTTGLSEDLAAERQIHDGKERTRPSVRPFTIADHLLAFCHPQEWTKGLMFHEHHVVPQSFTELRKKIRSKESQQTFRRAPSNLSSEESRRKQQQVESTIETAKLLANEVKHATAGLAESTRRLAESSNRILQASKKLKDALMGLVSRIIKEETEGKD